MNFVEQLSQPKIKKFLSLHQLKGRVSWSPQIGCAQLMTPNASSRMKIYFTDTTVKAPSDTEITNVDWQVFLRQVFGYRYMEAIEKKDFPIDFLYALSQEEILQLLPFYDIESIKECPVLQLGTRRFKIKPRDDAPIEEVILGPCYRDGTLRFYGVKEDEFYTFMATKFGDAYYEYFCKRAREDLKEEIFDYFLKRTHEVIKQESFIASFLPKEEE